MFKTIRMNRYLILFGILAQLLWACKKESNSENSYCSNRFFYDGIGNKLAVKEVYSKGMISFYDTLSNDTIRKILNPYKQIHITQSGATFIVVSIDSKSCSETDLLFNALKKLDQVSNCNKFLISNEKDSIGIYDVFDCKLKSDSLINQFNDLLLQTKTRIAGFDPVLGYYSIRADKFSEGDALDMANRFYESGYFEWSQPDFLMKIILSR